MPYISWIVGAGALEPGLECPPNSLVKGDTNLGYSVPPLHSPAKEELYSWLQFPPNSPA